MLLYIFDFYVYVLDTKIHRNVLTLDSEHLALYNKIVILLYYNYVNCEIIMYVYL